MSEPLETFPVPEFPQKRPSLIGEEVKGTDELVFVDNESGLNIALNAVAASVLELCDGRHSAADITALIVETTNGDADQVASDIRDILQEFAAYGLFQE